MSMVEALDVKVTNDQYFSSSSHFHVFHNLRSFILYLHDPLGKMKKKTICVYYYITIDCILRATATNYMSAHAQ